MTTIAITGASGKLGGATLSALLAHNLAPPSSIVALTSSSPGSPTWTALASKGVQVRRATFDSPASFDEALRGVAKFFLVSTPHIALDFGSDEEVPDGKGREGHHRGAIDAAVRAGVQHIYYSSLAFAWDAAKKAPGSTSKAGVMRAHLRTEAYLARQVADGKLSHVTILREGLYNESWPLYLGYFDVGGADADTDRTEVPLAADGPVSWTAIADLGVGSALVLTAASAEWSGKTFYLSTRAAGARGLAGIAKLVGEARGKAVGIKTVGRKEHERYYVQRRGEKEGPAVRWWAGTYEALEAGECAVDDPTLERLLERVGVKATGVEECIRAMVAKGQAGSRIFGLH
ncbi:NAD(P)-binding protein [Hypoxylon rubiginosum]|uniref:NAD(P)-binding protein n=1 Tax=Hypoxylon rubiginosum TaxID=110542 RepID=A0ACB9YNT9_9PEZI|nr:NAD(P)-binding protein [Hypoxylon rubiginosum]